MTPQEFLDEFGTLAESAEGVPKLRELILELAVQGRLVPHESNGQPVDDLMASIRDQREALIKAKKARRSKIEPVDESETPFDLPSHWQWVRLYDALLKITDGTHHSPTNTDSGEFKYVTAKNIKPDGVQLSNVTYVTKEVHDEIYERCDPELGDLLYIKDGATTGIVTINDLDEPFSMLSSVALLKRSTEIEPRFLLYVLRSPYFYTLMRGDMSGVAITRVTLAKLNKALIPLAPLAEQHRIVSKVDELMGLCDRLEAVQGERRGVRVRLNRSSLDRLTSSSTARGSGLSAAWQRVCDHFEVLYDTPETLPDLRQTILQLAVQGKLVPQDPNDELADELLKRIDARHAALVAAGKLRKPKELPAITGELLPFELPASWEWTALGKIQNFVNGFAFKSTEYQPEGVGIVRIGDIQNSGIATRDMKQVPDRYLTELDDRLQVRPGDLLIAMSGATTGKLGFNRTDETFLLNQRVGKLEFIEVDPDFAHLYLATQVQENLRISAGSAIPNLSTGQINEMAFPVAPLSEQKRIVSKVTHLLSQVTRLESTLTRRESTRTQLLTAAIHQMLKGET